MSISACPACSAAPLAIEIAAKSAVAGDIILSLPSIHCAGCIGTVERALMAVNGVTEARVNLSRKRVTIAATGIAPEQFIQTLEAVGYEAHILDAPMMASVDTDSEGRKLLLRIAVAGFAMMNVMLFSVAVWSGAAEATQKMFHWLSALIAVPALAFSAQVFFRHAWQSLRVGSLNMDVPISLAIILAAGLSVYETSVGGESVYFDAALSLTFFLLVGRYLDHRTRIAARSAAQELSALASPNAVLLVDGAQRTVPVTTLNVGDLIRVHVGMRVPVDGAVTHGGSDMDRSFLTGESLPVHVSLGDQIAAGEVNLTGPLTLRVTAVGEDTTLARMAALVETAEGARNKYTALADRAAQIYAPAVHLLAFVTFIGWFVLSRDAALALNIAISVLIITCPCALGLAVPAVMTTATGRLFRRGLLVKNGTALERLSQIDTVVFDKTGTLTEGHARIDTAAMDQTTLALLAALARASNHPVSKAIAAALPTLNSANITDVTEHAGQGIAANWQGQSVRLGSGKWLGCSQSPALKIGDAPAIPLHFSETLRIGAIEAIAALKSAGIPVHIFSGDTTEAVDTLAAKLDVTSAHAQMLPADKMARIKQLSDDGAKVLMIGDGLNDTGALAQAYASISPASALDASRAASDIVLLSRSLAEIPDAIRTAKSARLRVLENFGIAAAYNLVAVPVAILGFASPLSAAIAMSASSITVLVNALRVK